MSKLPPPSPTISQCSTATNSGFPTEHASTASRPTTSAPSIETSISTTTASSTATAASSSSAFSVIGKTLTKLIQNIFYSKPSAAVDNGSSSSVASKKFVQKRLRRRIAPPSLSSTSISTASSGNGGQHPKWIFPCHSCSKAITFNDVRDNNAIFALDGIWHRAHFCCTKCDCAIGAEEIPFVKSTVNGKSAAVCLDCCMAEENPKCESCKEPLFESAIEFEGKLWHQSCFVCEKCKAPFEGGEYSMINGKPYDLDCFYYKNFEAAFAPPPGFTDLALPSPPTLASSTDSAPTSPLTPSIIEDQTFFKKKNLEVLSLCDVGNITAPPPEKKKDLSAEIFETDHIKYPAALMSPPNEPELKPKTSSSDSAGNNKEKNHGEVSAAAAPVGVAAGGGVSTSKESIGEGMPSRKKTKSAEKLENAHSEEKKAEAGTKEESQKKAEDAVSSAPELLKPVEAPNAPPASQKPEEISKDKTTPGTKVQELLKDAMAEVIQKDVIAAASKKTQEELLKDSVPVSADDKTKEAPKDVKVESNQKADGASEKKEDPLKEAAAKNEEIKGEKTENVKASGKEAEK